MKEKEKKKDGGVKKKKKKSEMTWRVLEILNDCIVFHKLKNIYQCLNIGDLCVRYK